MHHLRILQVATIAALTLLASCGTNYRTVTAMGDALPNQANANVVATSSGPCAGMGDVFRVRYRLV